MAPNGGIHAVGLVLPSTVLRLSRVPQPHALLLGSFHGPCLTILHIVRTQVMLNAYLAPPLPCDRCCAFASAMSSTFVVAPYISHHTVLTGLLRSIVCFYSSVCFAFLVSANPALPDQFQHLASLYWCRGKRHVPLLCFVRGSFAPQGTRAFSINVILGQHLCGIPLTS